MGKALVIAHDYGVLRQKIRKALRSRWRTMGLVAVTIRRIVEAGYELIAAKGELEHGQFEAQLEADGIIGDGEDCVTKITVERWMRLARFHAKQADELERAQTVTKAYRLAGILPDIEESNSSSGVATTNYLVHLNRLSSSLSAQIKARPIEQWSPTDKAITRDRLRPLVEIYAQLEAP